LRHRRLNRLKLLIELTASGLLLLDTSRLNQQVTLCVVQSVLPA
jgi:hypothetical protein